MKRTKTKIAYAPQPVEPNPFRPMDRVEYHRTNGEIVRGFVDRTSFTAVYVFNTRTGETVGAPINRVTKLS